MYPCTWIIFSLVGLDCPIHGHEINDWINFVVPTAVVPTGCSTDLDIFRGLRELMARVLCSVRRSL